MEVLDENSAMLSNYEVLSLLKDFKAGKNQPSSVATISYEAVKYLEQMPCKQQSPEVIDKFMKEMISYDFTKAEKLQLLNLRPASVVELQLILEEVDERLKSEEEIEKLLELIQSLLPAPDATE
eukprot:gene6985-7770_t